MPGVPYNLIQALLEQGAEAPDPGWQHHGGAQQPRMPDMGCWWRTARSPKLFVPSPRPRDRPMRCRSQNITSLVSAMPNWCRKARWPNVCALPRAGIPAFYTPTAVGTGTRRRPRDPRDQRPRVFAGIRSAARLRIHSRASRRRLRQPAIPPCATQLQSGDGDRRSGAPSSRSTNRSCRAARSMPMRCIVPVCSWQRLVRVPPPPEGLWPTKRQERRR